MKFIVVAIHATPSSKSLLYHLHIGGAIGAVGSILGSDNKGHPQPLPELGTLGIRHAVESNVAARFRGGDEGDTHLHLLLGEDRF